MNESRKETDPLPLRFWAPIGLIILATFGLATLMRLLIVPLATQGYQQMEVKELPVETQVALDVSPFLAIPAIAAAIRGILLIRSGRRDDAFVFFLWMALVVMAVQALLIYGVLIPFFKIQTALSR